MPGGAVHRPAGVEPGHPRPLHLERRCTDLHLIKVRINPAVVSLVEAAPLLALLLQYLAGVNLDQLTALHKSDLADLLVPL